MKVSDGSKGIAANSTPSTYNAEIFAEKLPELFAGKEMGEDALRVLNEIIPLQAAIREDVEAELPHLREAVKWAGKGTRRGGA